MNDAPDVLFIGIPKPALIDKDLSDGEKMLYGAINTLSQLYGFCWATNYQLGRLLCKDRGTISHLISSLRERKYVDVVIGQGNYRKIYPMVKFDYRVVGNRDIIYNNKNKKKEESNNTTTTDRFGLTEGEMKRLSSWFVTLFPEDNFDEVCDVIDSDVNYHPKPIDGNSPYRLLRCYLESAGNKRKEGKTRTETEHALKKKQEQERVERQENYNRFCLEAKQFDSLDNKEHYLERARRCLGTTSSTLIRGEAIRLWKEENSEE